MCGIAGYIANHGAKADEKLIRAMCGRLAHRGPDGEGYFVENETALGHRRLSIIDLEGGHQPMGNEDASLQIVFNGEIYNFGELRGELEQRGHVFRTHSDTETLIHLYEDEGERMVERLNGMFAFAIWDRKRKEMFLARDRFGKKPLYYLVDGAGCRLAFASEIKALLALPGFGSPVDAASVAAFLSFSYVPEPRTIFSGVKKLPAAATLLVSASGERERRYWQLDYGGRETRREDAVARLDQLAGSAVAMRMISDVPLGAFLSGGVDSSAVVAYMSREAPGRVRSFSIGFTEREFDETRYARMVAERYQTSHHEETVKPDVEEMLDVLVNHYDEPFGDSSAVPSLYLARMTRRYVTVALSGDGADEVFGGYRRYRHGVIEERIRRRFPHWFRRTAFRAAGRWYPKLDFMPQVFRAKTLLGNLSMELGDAYYTSMTVFRDHGLRRILANGLRRDLGGYDSRAEYRERFRRRRELPPLQQMQAVDVETYLPGDILVKADRATMAYSLEGRSPWLDYRIAELAAQLPASWLIAGRDGKHIFKQTVAPLLPAEALWRKKMGFSVPLAQWFRTSLRSLFETEILGGGEDHLIDRSEARRLWAEHQSGLHNRDKWLWNLLMLRLWSKRYGGA